MKDTDPLRTLTRTPAYVQVGDTELVIPWHSALDWLTALTRDHAGIVLALAEDSGDLAVDLASGLLPVDVVEAASNELIEAETGRRWWVALKLAYSGASGDLLGELTLCGVDPARVSLGQWCAAVYRILTRNCETKDRIKIDFELELPPPGYEEAWDDGNDWSDFNALVQMTRDQEQRG